MGPPYGEPAGGGNAAAKELPSAATVPPSGLTPGCGTGGENDDASSGAIPNGGAGGRGVACGGAPPGMPREGPAMGATPTIVPFNLLEIAGEGAPGGGAEPVGPPGRAAGAAPGAGAPGMDAWFIMSIVPLNFGAATLFRWKLHFEQVCAASGFCVPQFGQNTPHLRTSAATNG